MMRSIRLTLAAALCLGLSAGCDGKVAVQYNDAVVALSKKLEAGDKTFGEAITKAVNGGPDDRKKLRSAYNQLKSEVEQVGKDFEALKVPAGQSASEFHTAAKTFFDAQIKLVQTDYNEVVTVLEDEKISPEEKKAKLDPVISRAGTTAKSQTNAMQQAQAKFAKDNKITLVK
jgi:hypothetical protein